MFQNRYVPPSLKEKLLASIHLAVFLLFLILPGVVDALIFPLIEPEKINGLFLIPDFSFASIKRNFDDVKAHSGISSATHVYIFRVVYAYLVYFGGAVLLTISVFFGHGYETANHVWKHPNWRELWAIPLLVACIYAAVASVLTMDDLALGGRRSGGALWWLYSGLGYGGLISAIPLVVGYFRVRGRTTASRIRLKLYRATARKR